MAASTFPSALPRRGRWVDAALGADAASASAIGAAAAASRVPMLLGDLSGDIYRRPHLAAADRERALDARAGDLSRPSAGRGGVHQGRDRAHRDAERLRPIGWTHRSSAPAPRSIRSARATSCVVLKPHVTPDRRHQASTSPPTAARGITTAACRSCSGARAWRRATRDDAGRNGRHHADAGRDDRRSARRRARSTASASSGIQA